MSVTDSSRAKHIVGAAWLVFAIVNLVLEFVLAGEETIPYHLIWASFALVYGFFRWARRTTWIVFVVITILTGIPLVEHAESHIIGWQETSEIVLMGVILAITVWHVNRHRTVQERLEELREVERRRAHTHEMAARFGSHEVRTRLTIARGLVEMIRDGRDRVQVQADAALVLSELDKASALATKLLTLVWLDVPKARVPVDIDELVYGIGRRWSAAAERNWSVQSTAGVLMADDERLEAALDCLIENAVKFTGPGDAITVDARRHGGEIAISVRDTGVGMPREDLERVFDAFETGSAAGDRAGSGIGLALVRGIVDSRGGRLEVDSTLGVGTTFTLRWAVERKALQLWHEQHAGGMPEPLEASSGV